MSEEIGDVGQKQGSGPTRSLRTDATMKCPLPCLKLIN